MFRRLCFCTGLLVLVISFTPAVSTLAQHLAVDWYQGDADVLIVLGGGMLVDGPDARATLGYDSYLRCAYASWNMQRFRYRYVLLTGSNGLAETMAKMLVARGAKREQLLVEDSAHTTFENAEFTKKILSHQQGLPEHPAIAIVTSDYHSRRARGVFARFGMPVRVVPAPDVLKRGEFIGQRWEAFLDLSAEAVKLVAYKVTGKL